MKKLLLSYFILFFFNFSWGQNEVLFFQTNWGYDGNTLDFVKSAKESGYDGIEVWASNIPKQQKIISQAIKMFDMKAIFLCGSNPNLPFEKSLEEYKGYLKNTLEQKPFAINSHTGSDFYTFEQNMTFISEADKLSKLYNIPIYHETHRGRFSYSLPETIKYLEKNEIDLTLDISHWMVVHESLLNKQKKLLDKVIQNTNHIHARVGFEEGPQVNDPRAPEWKNTVDRHIDIWESVILMQWDEKKVVTITTEFGPPNYMPTEPITKRPMSNQWEVNVFIMNSLKDRIKKIKN